MCSIGSEAAAAEPAQTDLAARLARAIDDLAAAAAAGDGEDGQDVAGLLARAWAMVADADPQLAARTARYNH
jgi:hypothetical protein